MKIMYFKGKQPNFGDELNPWLWPKIFPGFFDEDEKNLFIGIGSILGEKYSDTAKKIVFGAGYVRQYHGLTPDVHGTDWDVYFVRGPKTAQMLDISPDLAVGDSAILLRTIIDVKRHIPQVVSFMPHWQSLEPGNWEKVCRLSGINFIDPCRPVEEILTELFRSSMVITEAMHGAIVADALRIPWVPLLPINSDHREKWFDWAEALKINLRHHRLWPSSMAETRVAFMHRPTLDSFVRSVAASPFSAIVDKTAIHAAAYRLTKLAKISPYLSDDREMNRVTEIMLEKAEKLRRNGPMR